MRADVGGSRPDLSTCGCAVYPAAELHDAAYGQAALATLSLQLPDNLKAASAAPGASYPGPWPLDAAGGAVKAELRAAAGSESHAARRRLQAQAATSDPYYCQDNFQLNRDGCIRASDPTSGRSLCIWGVPDSNVWQRIIPGNVAQCYCYPAGALVEVQVAEAGRTTPRVAQLRMTRRVAQLRPGDLVAVLGADGRRAFSPLVYFSQVQSWWPA